MQARKELFPRYFPDAVYPPNTILVVSRLVLPDLLVEIEAMAVKPAGAAAKAPAPARKPAARAGARPPAPPAAEGVAEARMMSVPARFNAAQLLHRPPRRRGARGQGRLLPRRRLHHLRSAPGAGQSRGQRPARPGRAAGAARAVPAARLAGVPRHVLGRDQDRRDPDPREHHDAERRLPVLPRRQPRARRGRLGAPAGRGGPGARRGARFLRHVVVAGRASGAPDRVRRLGRPRRARGSSPSTPRRTIPRSGSTRRARPAVPRAPCTCSTTWWCAARPTRSRSWA